MSRKQVGPSRVQHVGHRAAWKYYIRGNVIYESSVTLITNLLSACSAMANHKDDEEERDDQDQQQENIAPWLTGSATLSVQQLHGLVQEMTHEQDGKKGSDTKTSKTLLASLKRGASMWTDTPMERRSLRCNTQSGTVIATPVGSPTRTEAQAENNGRLGGHVSAYKFCGFSTLGFEFLLP